MYAFQVQAYQLPNDFFIKEDDPQSRFFLNKIQKGIQGHEEILNDLLDERDATQYRLDRYDLQFGFTASGEFGVLSAGGEGAIEFIWQRNLDSGDAGDDIDEEEWIERTIEVDWSITPEEIEEAFIRETNRIVKLSNLRSKVRKRIIRRFRKDAESITRAVKEMVLLPRIGDWYIGGFFQNYNFSKGFSLGIFSLGHDLRMRFRFKINAVPMLYTSLGDFTKRQRSLRKLMLRFNAMGDSSSSIHKQFKLKRVWAIHDWNFGLSLGAVSFGMSRGLQIEYKRLDDNLSLPFFEGRDAEYFKPIQPANFINNKLVSVFDKSMVTDTPDELSLHQIRVKYTGDLEAGVELVSIGKSETLEFHYKR